VDIQYQENGSIYIMKSSLLRQTGNRLGKKIELYEMGCWNSFQIDEQEDVEVMLQPTSPLRKLNHVSATIEKLINESFDAVWTISGSDSKSPPLKQLIFEDDALDYYDSQGKDIIARQQLSPVFYRNGAAYAITRDCLLESKVLMGKQTGAVLIDEEMVSIDTEWDIELIDFILSRNRV